LGHKPRNLYKILKDEMQKGLFAEVPSVYSGRFEKNLCRLTGGNWHVRVYSSFDRALAAAEKLLARPLRETDIQEPFFAPSREAPVFFRPCTDPEYSRFSLVFPVLPFPGGFAPQPLLIGKKNNAPEPAAGDLVSPVLLAGLTHLAEELQKTPKIPDIWKEWKLPGWTRFGCYCFPRPVPENYETVFNRFLEGGVIISPDPERPTLLPRLFSPGEQRLVEGLCTETAQGEPYER
jgi:hypothetical protein